MRLRKAHPKVINLFLQVLDAGTLYDNKYEANIAFGETVIIFTTNAGKSLYQDTTKHNYSDVPKKVILDALEKECHPVTGRPVFPQAICSRLATGNVLLFNHLTAHQLSTIAARKLMEQQASLYQEVSILSEDAESLATTLLFSLGGHCDARNMTAAAKRFFSAELFELYRLAGTDRKAMAAGGIQKIRWQLDIDRTEPIIRQLYHVPEDNTFLFFGSEEARMQAQQMAGEQMDPVFQQVYADMTSLLDSSVTNGNAMEAKLNVFRVVIFIVILLIIGVGFAGSEKAGKRIAKGIAGPLKALADRLDGFAAGDLSSEFPEVKTEDEVAEMNRAAIAKLLKSANDH